MPPASKQPSLNALSFGNSSLPQKRRCIAMQGCEFSLDSVIPLTGNTRLRESPPPQKAKRAREDPKHLRRMKKECKKTVIKVSSQCHSNVESTMASARIDWRILMVIRPEAGEYRGPSDPRWKRNNVLRPNSSEFFDCLLADIETILQRIAFFSNQTSRSMRFVYLMSKDMKMVSPEEYPD